MIAKLLDKVKPYAFDAFLLACVVLIAVISYNLGRLQALDEGPLAGTQDSAIMRVIAGDATSPATRKGTPLPTPVPTPRDPRVVASKNSTGKLYYHPWCGTAKRIKQENQIWFPTEDAAKSAGYTLAGNCN